MNFTQVIDSPTCHNPKCPDKSTFIDLFITNNTYVSVFLYNVCENCFIAAIRDTRIPKVKPCASQSVIRNTSVNRVTDI